MIGTAAVAVAVAAGTTGTAAQAEWAATLAVVAKAQTRTLVEMPNLSKMDTTSEVLKLMLRKTLKTRILALAVRVAAASLGSSDGEREALLLRCLRVLVPGIWVRALTLVLPWALEAKALLLKAILAVRACLALALPQAPDMLLVGRAPVGSSESSQEAGSAHLKMTVPTHREALRDARGEKSSAALKLMMQQVGP